MEYRVETVQLPSGRWQCVILKGDEIYERDTGQGHTTAEEARTASSPYLGDHITGWAVKQAQPQIPTPKMAEPKYDRDQLAVIDRALVMFSEMGL
jgi:hypothetical protein